MTIKALRYWTNLFRITATRQLPAPLAVVYMVTRRCNLNCAYCEDFGKRLSADTPLDQPLDTSLQLLRRLRALSPNLTLTGGEPLLHPHIDALVSQTRLDLGFEHITLLTNALLLAEHQTLLPHLDRLVISFDSMNTEQWNETIEKPSKPAAMILENIQFAARRQQIDHFRLVLNCVLNEQNLTEVSSLVEFCTEIGALFSLSPQAVSNWPKYELVTSEKYRETIQWLINAKKRGAPILGSLRYLTSIRDIRPFICYPTLVPRFYPEGGLAFPCRPIEKENNGHGSRITEIADGRTWGASMQAAQHLHGVPPHICSSCFQQCYIEPSLMQQAPLQLLMEVLRFPASRAGQLATYSPG